MHGSVSSTGVRIQHLQSGLSRIRAITQLVLLQIWCKALRVSAIIPFASRMMEMTPVALGFTDFVTACAKIMGTQNIHHLTTLFGLDLNHSAEFLVEQSAQAHFIATFSNLRRPVLYIALISGVFSPWSDVEINPPNHCVLQTPFHTKLHTPPSERSW